MSEIKRSYLVSYEYEGGMGRFFVDSPNDRMPTRADIEEWERQIRDQNGFKLVFTMAFSRIQGPALSE